MARQREDTASQSQATGQSLGGNDYYVIANYDINDGNNTTSHAPNDDNGQHNQVTCRRCQRICPSEQALKRHMEDRHVGRYCYWPGCGTRTATEADLINHLIEEHQHWTIELKIAGEIRLLCPWPGCSKTFARKEWIHSQREKHARIQEPKTIVAFPTFSTEKSDNRTAIRAPQYYGRRCVGLDKMIRICLEISEFPDLQSGVWNQDFICMIHLDKEIFSINYQTHWKLESALDELNKLIDSSKEIENVSDFLTALKHCPDSCMLSPALPFLERKPQTRYDYRIVTPNTSISEPYMTFLTCASADIIFQYRMFIVRLGRQLRPDSFAFRELAFALLSITSGPTLWRQSSVWPWPPENFCKSHERFWDGRPPILEFGSMNYQSGKALGASPTEPTYWFKGVLISLVLVVDGEAIARAADWGIKQGRTHFQIIVLNLFDVEFAEVSFHDGHQKPYIKMTKPLALSPMRMSSCLGKHPMDWPGYKLETEFETDLQGQHRERILEQNYGQWAKQKLLDRFPGLMALVKFFKITSDRSAACKSWGVFPPELFDRILDFVDYDTWKACLLVSPWIRRTCLRRYRLNSDLNLVAGPLIRTVSRAGVSHSNQHFPHGDDFISFDTQNRHTGAIFPIVLVPDNELLIDEMVLMPVVGEDQKAIMMEIRFQLMTQTQRGQFV
ncbi:hypothetical protein F4777DRAFT_594563 [Nemania sp. FL0916]|nr:hypothetical protein F4777DRAFT_594563 [Nemania sp. FL0916]